MPKLTERQQQILSFIRQRIQTERIPPTIREIGEHFKINSPNGVMCHIRALEQKGYLTRQRMRSRTLRLVETTKVG